MKKGSGIVSKKKNNRRIYRWKEMGFTSNRRLQEFYYLFKLPYCQDCNMSRILHHKAFGYNLSIHHIDNNKLNNKPSNLSTLCFICHTLIDSSFHLHYRRLIGKKATLHPEFVKYRNSLVNN